MRINLKLVLIRSAIFGLMAVLATIAFITVFFSFGKIEFWIYNRANQPIEIKSCIFEGENLPACPLLVPQKGDQVSVLFQTETLLSLNKDKVYTLDLDFIINGKKFEEKIKFRKQRGWCIEMISIAANNKIHASTLCSNPIS